MSSKSCCENRATPYCPMCGGEIAAPPLVTLLRHVSKTLKTHAASHETYVDKEKLAGGTNQYLQKVVRRREESLKKWQSWKDALEKVLEDA